MIDYTNFKHSVEGSELHALYAKFWSDHHACQHRRMYIESAAGLEERCP
jgi:hypothetical protein